MLDTFSLFAILLAVTILGVSKGGFGGVGTPVALPVMSLGLPPELALGVLLPLLLATDVVSVSSHRRNADYKTAWYALPGAVLGVGLGALFIAITPGDIIGGAVGLIAILFAIMALTGRNPDVSGWPNWVSSVFGALSGLTSTLAHAGGPPIHIYLLSRGYAPGTFVATSSVFMAGVNVIKIAPYILIGTLDKAALVWALYLAPIAILAAFAGVWLSRVLSKTAFKYGVNSLLIVAGAKLLFDALT